jgi:hypothetical protein
LEGVEDWRSAIRLLADDWNIRGKDPVLAADDFGQAILKENLYARKTGMSHGTEVLLGLFVIFVGLKSESKGE